MHEKTLKIKEKLAFRLIKLLGEYDWREINNKILLQEIPNEKIKTLEWLANDKAELLKIYFNIINIKILTEAEKDFSDDQEASVREKLVDIILRKCEHHEKDKTALKKIKFSVFYNSEISVEYVCNFMFLSKQALYLAGDDLIGYRGKLRKIGVCGVFGVIFENWLSNNLDSSKLLSMADKYISRAEEYALFLNLIIKKNIL